MNDKNPTKAIQEVVARHEQVMLRELTETLVRALTEQEDGARAVREIIGRYAEAMTKDLTETLIAQIAVNVDGVVAGGPRYNGRKRLWQCPYCTFRDRRRRSVTAHIRSCQNKP